MMWPDARSAGEALELHFAVAPSDRERVTRKLTARDLEAGLADRKRSANPSLANVLKPG